MNYLKYFDVGIGSVPIILSCPHGGFLKPKIIPDRANGVIISDKNTFIIAKQIIKKLTFKNVNIYYILNKIHRSKIDFNRPPRGNLAFDQSSLEAQRIYLIYDDYIKKFTQECVSLYNRCLFIDLHGFTKPHNKYPDIIFGNLFGKTLKIDENPKNKDFKIYWGFSKMVRELSKHFTLDDGLGVSDFNLAYSGGYITHQFYRRNYVNAFQLEVAKNIRENLNLTKKFIEVFAFAIINCLKV